MVPIQSVTDRPTVPRLMSLVPPEQRWQHGNNYSRRFEGDLLSCCGMTMTNCRVQWIVHDGPFYCQNGQRDSVGRVTVHQQHLQRFDHRKIQDINMTVKREPMQSSQYFLRRFQCHLQGWTDKAGKLAIQNKDE
jgi:hypothetical protein